jgi:thiamine pyrophosphate-dependent acetolactate synthase large subunit-like protein
VHAAADLLEKAERPLLVGGRGAVLSEAREPIAALGERCGALLATSAMAHGLFAGLPYDLRISGGFSSPLAAELIPQADVIVAFGATLNQWTTRHGALIGPEATLVQIDLEAGAIGNGPGVELAVLGDAAATAEALLEELEGRGHESEGWRGATGADLIEGRRWRSEPYEESKGSDRIDPRTLSIELNRRLPQDRVVVVDSGHFLGYPAMYLDVPDARSWIFPNAFQAVGLGLGCAIGAAVANPERITVAAVGDGGLFMALPELETAVRLGLSLLVVVYDDAAYGAEAHHFGPDGAPLDTVRFPDADLAAIARGAGAAAETVRAAADLDTVERWAAAPSGPLVVDAKVDPNICAEWLEEAFRGG